MYARRLRASFTTIFCALMPRTDHNTFPSHATSDHLPTLSASHQHAIPAGHPFWAAFCRVYRISCTAPAAKTKAGVGHSGELRDLLYNRCARGIQLFGKITFSWHSYRCFKPVHTPRNMCSTFITLHYRTDGIAWFNVCGFVVVVSLGLLVFMCLPCSAAAPSF